MLCAMGATEQKLEGLIEIDFNVLLASCMAIGVWSSISRTHGWLCMIDYVYVFWVLWLFGMGMFRWHGIDRFSACMRVTFRDSV